jgi:glutamate synthase (NADPH/NADH) large chain/glutamate synthase (ferredoxin)
LTLNSEENDLDWRGIDLSRLLADPDPTHTRPRRNLQSRNDPIASQTLDDWLLDAALPAVETNVAITLDHAIQNIDRAVGARIAGEIARRYGDRGLASHTINVRLHGSAGQSLGAFCINGLHLHIVGEANDYVGKSMSGGEIVIRPPLTARFATQENFIIGNTVLYGATGGKLFAAGRAGERFAVRNSGAVAVVEGVGDHGCEYMTGGIVVVLGATGRNFGAGMTGGVAFVFDDAQMLPRKLNSELVRLMRLADDADETRLRDLVQQHMDATESKWAQHISDEWQTSRENFWKVLPK